MINISLPTINQKMTQARTLLLLLLCLAIGQVLVAQTYTTIAGVSSGGSFTFDDPSNWLNGQAPPNPIPASATVEIRHTIYMLPSLANWTNNGTIDVSNSGFFLVGNVLDNNGTIDIADNHFMHISQGTLNNKPGGIIQGWHLSLWNTATLNNEAGGMIEIKSSLNKTSQGSNVLNNAGTLIITEGDFISRGQLTNSAGGLIEIRGTQFFFNSPFSNSGAVRLLNAARMSRGVSGAYTGLAGSSLEWVLSASGSAGTDYPYVSYSIADPVAAFAQTTFIVSLASGYEPAKGDQFNIFFGFPIPTNAISLPALSNGNTWQNISTSSQIIFEVPVPASPGAALASNSSSQLVSVPDDASLDIECQLSIELWCKPSGFVTWGAMVMKASPNSWSNGYGIYLFGSELKFFPTGFGTQHSSGQNLPFNQWSHVAATYDGTESKIYINGALVSTKSIGQPIPTNNFPMGVGGDPGFPSFNFRGALDEVRVWNKVLTQAEIQANMNCEIQTTSDCLVANYHFNQGVAGQDNTNETTLTDASGNGNDGTLIGYQLTGTTSNWIEPGGVTSGQACNSSIVCEPIVSAPPTCPSNVVVSNDDGLCGAYVAFAVESGDLASPPSGSYFPVGTTTVVITGSSGCGEAQTCSFTVTVNDTEKPSISCPSNTTVGTDDGECGADVHLPAPSANDNCGVTELKGRYRLVDENDNPLGSYTSRMNDPSDHLAVGRYQINWRAKDAANNKRSCSYYVTVVDDEDPTAVCKDVTVDFNGEASIDLGPSQVWNEAASDDNCGVVHYVGTSPSLSISCDDLGSVIPLTVTIRDEAGNTDHCTADVTVTGLPCGWSEGADDGSLNCQGDTDVDYDTNDESFAVSADGCWHDCRESDKAAFVYQELCGDGTLTARLASINTKGYAGLMLRESLDPDARRAGALKNYSTRRVRREYRSTYGGIVTQSHSNRSRVEWFRIVRKGNEVKSYTSTNGSNWRLLYRVVFPNLEDCVYIGMMAYSTNGSSTVDAVFDNVSFSGSGSSLIDNNNSLPDSFTAFDTELEIEQPDVNIFPNPSNGQSQIELNGFQETPAQIMVRDAFGKVVRQIEVDYPEGTVLPLDLQDMPAGLYLISVMQDQQQVITKKLMIQK